MIEERTHKVIVCDGCDYDIGKVQRVQGYIELFLPFKVETTERSSGKLVFHFHEIDKEHDCLRYWLTGFGILERSLARRGSLLSDEAKALIVKSLRVTTNGE